MSNITKYNTNQNKPYPYNQTTQLITTSSLAPINYTQTNPNSTSALLLSQL